MPDIAGNSLGTATSLSLTSNVQTLPDIVTSTANDYYRFTLSHRSSFNLSLASLSADANVALLNSTGSILSVNGVLQTSSNTGNLAESINTTLDVGTYYIRVAPGASSTSANYSLNVSAFENLKSDILWRNYATGENGIWQLSGTSLETSSYIQAATEVNWAIQGSGDFNRDGQADLLWRNYKTGENAVWLMNGAVSFDSIYLQPTIDLNWQIQGTGDFNRDGKVDIVWRNYQTGENAVWLMDGTVRTASVYLQSVNDSNWHIQGAGDFNGDGKTDLVWRNYGTGQNAIWLLNGAIFSTGIYIDPVDDPNWIISGVGDFNNDGQTDLLWRNYGSGQNAIWLLNGTTYSSGFYINPVSDTNWRSLSPFVRTVEPTPISVAGNALANAFNVGSNVTGSGTYRSAVGDLNSDYYQLNVSTPSAVSLTLTGLTNNLDVQLVSSSNQVLQSSTLGNTSAEAINSTLNAGTYYVRVYAANGGGSAYALNLLVNNLPVVVTNAGLTLDEGTTTTLSSSLLQVTDNDNPVAQLTYTLGSLPGRGALSLNGAAIGAGTTFTQLDINTNQLRYRHDGSETLTDSFSFTVSDLAGGTIASNTFNITVNPVNDAPILTVPSGQTVDQNANSLIAGVSVADLDLGTGNETITISAANGLVSLGVTTGLTFAQGTGSPAASITASGTLSALNNALNSLIYRSNASFQGTDTISLLVNDNGNTGKGGALADSKTIAVTVNAVNKPPVITVPTAQSVNEDTSLSLAGISISDVDAGGGNETVSLSAVNGVLSFGATAGLTFLTGTGAKDRNVTISGTLALINAALNSLTYQGDRDFNGSDVIIVSVNDNGNTGNGVALSDTKSLFVTVTPVNDAPLLSVPAAQVANENTTVYVTGISIGDVDAGSGAIAVSLAATNGKLSLGSTTGLSFTSGNGSPNASLIFSGTLAAINSALSTLLYQGNANFSGADSISINVNDNGNTGFGIPLSDSKTIAVTVLGVNQAPVIQVPLAPSTTANTNLTIVGVSISDPDAAGGNETVTIAAANGVLSLPSNTGLTFLQGTGDQNNRLTFRGTLAAINTAIGNLVYRSYPGFIGFDTITISVNDEGNTGIGTALSDTKTLFVNVGGAVNIPPTASADSYTTTRNTALTITGQGVLTNDTDPENNALTANLLTTPTKGTVVFNSNGTFIYTPNANYVGSDSFTYRASDGIGNSSPATVRLSVTAPANQAPTAVADAFTLSRNSTFTTGNVLTNDSDPDGNVPLTAQLVAAPTQGSLALNSNGTFTYIPTTNFTGNDSFTYVARDALGAASTTATVNLSVTAPANQAPSAVADAFTLSQNSTFTTGNVLTNDSDPDGNVPLTAQLATTATQGSLALNSNGTFTYIPTTNFTGNDSFTYVARDALGAASTIATVSLVVNAVNQSPIAVGDSFRAVTNTPLTVSAANGVLKNDTDVDSLTLTALLVGTPGNGSVALNSDGAFVYTPIANFNGTDTFTYKANDGNSDSNLVTVTLTVSGNTAPTANPDTYTVAAGVPLAVIPFSGVLQNDSDVEGDTLTASLLTSSSGSLALSGDGSFVYTPTAGVTSGTDTFVYRVSDGFLTSSPATVTLSIGANAAPIALNDTYNASAGTTLTVNQLSGVLSNDTDAQPLTASVVSNPGQGTLILGGNGSFSYVPNASFTSGTDTFVYQASDGSLATSATVTLNVSAATAPIAQNDTYQVVAGTTLNVGQTFSVLNNDSSTNGTPLTAQLFSPPSQGTVVLNADGSFTYTPNAGVTNTIDTFVYRSNNSVPSSPATVTLSITSNARPVATNDSYAVDANSPLTISPKGVLANDTDSDVGQTLGVFLSGQPDHGTLLLRVDGSFIYTPDPGYLGVDTFTYRVNDGFQDSTSLGTVSLSIAANAAPIANPDTYSVNKNNVLIKDAANGVLKNDTDVSALTASVVNAPTQGSLALNGNGSFTYTPNAGVTNTTDTFVYKASDGSLDTNATVTVTIKDTSALPTAVNDTGYTVNANGALTVTATAGVLTNDTDPDGDVLKAVSGTPPSQGTVTLNNNGSFVYVPTAGYIGADSFTYFANDGIGSSSSPATVSIVVGGVNSPPTIAVPGSQVVFRNTDLVIQSGLTIGDADAGANLVGVTLTATSGNLTLSTTSNLTVSGNGSPVVTLTGSIANLNAALTNLVYRPVDVGFTGSDQIAIAVNDNGNTGTGGAQTTSATISVNVTNGPTLVRDLNPTQNATATGTVSSSPSSLTNANGTLFFSANDGTSGIELWRSDGTNAGTSLVADLNTTPDTSGSSNPGNLTVIGSTLYFTANNSFRGTELWKADLTGATAPSIVKDIRAGGSSSLPRNLVNFNGTLYFEADDGSGLVLWKTDGTTTNTIKVETTPGYTQPGLLVAAGSTLYFTASNGNQLWRMNAAGTQTTLLQDIGSGAGITNLVAIGNTLFFTASDSSGVELWRSDGTAAGTTRISDINAGVGDANPSSLVNLNGTLYFLAKNGSNVYQLWQSTASGALSPASVALPSAGQAPTSLTVVGSKLFFVVDAGTSTVSDLQLWQSTGSGASLVKSINPTGNDAVASLTNVNGSLFFTANDGSTRIWKSDGTGAGTVSVSANFTGIAPHNLTAVGNRLFFTAETTTTILVAPDPNNPTNTTQITGTTGEELFVL